MLIDVEQDDRELLRAEDDAIAATEQPPPHIRTRLDELTELLNGRETQVHETTEG